MKWLVDQHNRGTNRKRHFLSFFSFDLLWPRFRNVIFNWSHPNHANHRNSSPCVFAFSSIKSSNRAKLIRNKTDGQMWPQSNAVSIPNVRNHIWWLITINRGKKRAKKIWNMKSSDCYSKRYVSCDRAFASHCVDAIRRKSEFVGKTKVSIVGGSLIVWHWAIRTHANPASGSADVGSLSRWKSVLSKSKVKEKRMETAIIGLKWNELENNEERPWMKMKWFVLARRQSSQFHSADDVQFSGHSICSTKRLLVVRVQAQVGPGVRWDCQLTTRPRQLRFCLRLAMVWLRINNGHVLTYLPKQVATIGRFESTNINWPH